MLETAPLLKFKPTTMIFPEDQVDELKSIAPILRYTEEGSYTYIFIENLQLPEGCTPSIVNALLCPTPREGYESRLFFSVQITGCPVRNWNGNIRVLGTNWFAISWRTLGGLRLRDMLIVHLKALQSE